MGTVKIMTVVGARPQFIKAAMVSRAIVEYNSNQSRQTVVEEIVHTGQHYDDNMSQIFFDQMGIPAPAANLQIGSGHHGEMTGKQLAAIEKEILQRKPDWVLVYGDTNSTLSGALAAVKLHVPVAHVEAGLRSFNRNMPEEINRILTDNVSTLLLCPTQTATDNLKAEGISEGVHHVGDVMYDAARVFGELAEEGSTILDRLGISEGKYCLCTVHRAENTDEEERLRSVFKALDVIGREHLVVLPLHPRTRMFMVQYQIVPDPAAIKIIDPVSFLDMVRLQKDAHLILTDSGGIQKEAYFHGVPCVTLRDETEWIETVDAGWNIVAGADSDTIVTAATNATTGRSISDYGSGFAADKVLRHIV